MEKKSVLLDLGELNNPTSGFGQIVNNYARIYSALEDGELRFHFLLPRGCESDFGPNVDCTSDWKKNGKGMPDVNLWHSTNQQQIKHARGKCDKFVLTIHDLNYLTEKNWLRQLKHHFFLQRAINHADAVTCISKFVAGQVEQQFKLKGKPVRVIYNGVQDISAQLDAKPPFANERPFFFAIGQIRKKKNFHLLVDMMRNFPDYDLYICGDDHFDFARVVREHISALPTHNAYLTGKISQQEKVWLYRHCEAFLFPSQGEGFGLPAIEAMQFGRAVFISSYTCLPEICGNCAHVWPSLNPEEMSKEILKVLPHFYEDKERLERIRQHAAQFSYDKHISSYLDLYKELLGIKKCD